LAVEAPERAAEGEDGAGGDEFGFFAHVLEEGGDRDLGAASAVAEFAVEAICLTATRAEMTAFEDAVGDGDFEVEVGVFWRV